MSRLPDLEGWAIFARVAELGSFAAAAAALGVSTATVSKAVARLEARVGAALLARTSRSVALTELGRTVAESARRVVREAEAVEEEATGAATRPRGLLRIAAPMSFGVRFVAPFVPDFLAAYPDLRIDLALDDRVVDLVAEGFDVAVRLAALPDSGLRSRRVSAMRRHLLASPAYLARVGAPASPDALGRHVCLEYANHPAAQRWRFRRDGIEKAVATSGPFRVNNGEAMTAGLLAGLGIALLPEFMIVDEVRAGRLVVVLPEWEALPSLHVHLLTPPSARRPFRVEACLDRLARHLATVPSLP